MARIAGGRQWPDGDRIWLNVKADDDFPEALLQAQLIFGDLFGEMVNVVTHGANGDETPVLLEVAAAEFGIDLSEDDEPGGE